MAEDDTEGKYCYFHRDLVQGSYGGDVACLQQFLRREGYLKEQPSGFFGPVTEDAVTRWQTSNNLPSATGKYGYVSRSFYAKKFKLPTIEQLRGVESQAKVPQQTYPMVSFFQAQSSKKVVNVCLEVEDVECCQNRRLSENASKEDKFHLCQEACQVAAADACDRAYPITQVDKYKHCISQIAKQCRRTCERTVWGNGVER